jgi:hypothetical protein
VGGAQEVIVESEMDWMRRRHNLSSEVQRGRVEGKGRLANELDKRGGWMAAGCRTLLEEDCAVGCVDKIRGGTSGRVEGREHWKEREGNRGKKRAGMSGSSKYEEERSGGTRMSRNA